MKAIILAGGGGTRLWPLSRESKPKQFQKLITNQTLLEDTLDRLDFLKPKDIFIATSKAYAGEVTEIALKKGIKENQIIVEPALRDTAACIGLAAKRIEKAYPGEVMAIIYADHLIKNKQEFIEKLKVAEKLAREENTLNIIEVKAKYPSTALGYVKIGKMLKIVNGTEIYAFEKFTEKPNKKTAEEYVASYKYLWNTGIYVWKTSVILQEIKKHMPKTYDLLEKDYEKCEKTSIDYGVMEKIDPTRVRIIPAELGWNDIGTWEAIYDELNKNGQNVTKGTYTEIDTENSLIYGSGKKIIATIGLKNIVIIDTPDALLVCDKSQSGRLKEIVEKIKKINPQST
ncbi:MAG: mannose-1-phosphate guanylyltransferase, mannose-1-phosphate guanylyltransferase [Candidatus Peregrinibacteria bacterium GW2011_GWC2_39_14]|nr:MAG: mannose-1-phosphate guanylyltransferase, mannose-1-phosphate guanylyltransferase [Candidatus Peregrinibacteria bacterium GW2011_GWC2_39_14]